MTEKSVFSRVVFSSTSPHWKTPAGLYKTLDAEFHFDDDPCPINGEGGLDRPWGRSAYVNPPYGKPITKWLQKAIYENSLGKTVVMLLPARTDTVWFHEFALPCAHEVRFVLGRLKFNGSKNSAPFPSLILIFCGRRGRIGRAKGEEDDTGT